MRIPVTEEPSTRVLKRNDGFGIARGHECLTESTDEPDQITVQPASHGTGRLTRGDALRWVHEIVGIQRG